MIKAVVFDLDDTLISEKQYVKSGFREVSKFISNKYNLNQEEVFNIMLQIFEESSKDVFNRVLNNFRIEYAKEEILCLIKIYREHIPEIEFFGDVIPTLNKLRSKGIKIGIITDGYKETQSRKLEVLKCYELFDEIIMTDELGREFWKPHEKAYRLIAEKLGVNLNEMIYIGDNISKDFISANKLRIMSVCINRHYGIYKNIEVNEEYLAMNNIESLEEIEVLV